MCEVQARVRSAGVQRVSHHPESDGGMRTGPERTEPDQDLEADPVGAGTVDLRDKLGEMEERGEGGEGLSQKWYIAGHGPVRAWHGLGDKTDSSSHLRVESI